MVQRTSTLYWHSVLPWSMVTIVTETIDRRSQILDAAERLVRQHGLTSASVRAVAAEAGIGASTLRHYYPSQRDLYVAIVARMQGEATSHMRISDTDVDPLTRLTECLMQFLPPDEDTMALLAAYADTLSRAFGAEGDPTIRAAYTRLSAEGAQQQRVWLEQLASEGRLREPVDDVLPLLHTIVDGVAVQLLTGQGELSIAGARRQIEMLLQGSVVTP